MEGLIGMLTMGMKKIGNSKNMVYQAVNAYGQVLYESNRYFEVLYFLEAHSGKHLEGINIYKVKC